MSAFSPRYDLMTCSYVETDGVVCCILSTSCRPGTWGVYAVCGGQKTRQPKELFARRCKLNAVFCKESRLAEESTVEGYVFNLIFASSLLVISLLRTSCLTINHTNILHSDILPLFNVKLTSTSSYQHCDCPNIAKVFHIPVRQPAAVHRSHSISDLNYSEGGGDDVTPGNRVEPD